MGNQRPGTPFQLPPHAGEEPDSDATMRYVAPILDCVREIQDQASRIYEASKQLHVLAEQWNDSPALVHRVPSIWQRDRLRWAGKRYSRGSSLTFEQAGCLVFTYCALAQWAGYEVDPVAFAAALDEAGGFANGEVSHPSAITRALPRLKWHGAGDRWILGKETSFVNWESRPVDLEVLRWVLAVQPAPAKVDFVPGGAVQQHFVLAVQYIAATDSEGIYDDLLVMDPWTGTTTGVRAYAHPEWLLWCKLKQRSLVQRVLLGLRVPELIGG